MNEDGVRAARRQALDEHLGAVQADFELAGDIVTALDAILDLIDEARKASDMITGGGSRSSAADHAAASP